MKAALNLSSFAVNFHQIAIVTVSCIVAGFYET
jgi:hypothetical protein